MALENIDPTADSLAVKHFLSVTSNVLERYNQLVQSDGSDVDTVTKILTQTTEAYNLYSQLRNSDLDITSAQIITLKDDLDSIVADIQSKLDSGYFKGDKGDKGDPGTSFNNIIEEGSNVGIGALSTDCPLTLARDQDLIMRIGPLISGVSVKPFIRFQSKDSAGENNYGDIGFNPEDKKIFFRVPHITEKFAVTENGITFNGDTASTNALDDYEEGTWDPTITDNTGAELTGISYDVRQGTYVKVGKVVNVGITLSFSADDAQSLGRISLPFARNDQSSHYPSSLVAGINVDFGGASTQLAGYIATVRDYITIVGNSSGGAQTVPLTTADTMDIRISMSYITA